MITVKLILNEVGDIADDGFIFNLFLIICCLQLF